MPWVRRTRHLGLTAATGAGAPRVIVHSYLTDRRRSLSPGELDVVLAFPTSRWDWRSDALARDLAAAGILVCDEPGEPFEALRRRDEELTATGWAPEALRYHLTTRWDGVTVRMPPRDGPGRPVPRPAMPPLPPFPERGGPRTALPPADEESVLETTLAARRTARHFDDARCVELGQLATLLRRVWGPRASAPVAPGDVALRKASPSGGGLHPVEVYPLVRRVSGLEPGLYHYLTGAHELELIAAADEAEVTRLVDRGTAGQWYFADADVAFVMTARFGRSFWKYRRHAKAYRTLLLDTGHLSQTFYLACTEAGLGPWVTAALDDGALERALGIDPVVEGVMAMCGCGWPAPERGRFDTRFEPLPR